MESRQLQYFLAIASCGSMSKAAEILHISQPALSSALRNLEKEIGQNLFDRVGKKLVINRNGRYLAEQARAAFNILNEAKRTIQDNEEKNRKSIRCSTNIPMGNVGAMIRGFYKKHPGITISMGYANSPQFANKALDMELVSSVVKIDDENHIPLGKERILVVLPPDHDLAEADTIKLADLKDEAFLFSNPGEFRAIGEAMCQKAGFSPYVAMEMQLYGEIMSLVENGLGCCFAGEFTWLAGMENTYRFAAKQPSDVERHRYLYVRIPEHRTPTESTWTFIDYLQDYADSLKLNG